jgi:ribosome-binding factor A
VDDPLIGFVTITGVKMSADLKHAEVFFSAIGEPEAKEDAFKGLKRACKYIRRLIGERLELRYVPQLRFHVDDTPEKAQRIERILRADPATAGDEAGEAQSDEPEQ